MNYIFPAVNIMRYLVSPQYQDCIINNVKTFKVSTVTHIEVKINFKKIYFLIFRSFSIF